MARKKQPVANGYVLFDVLYESGMRTSNRKVPASELNSWEGDAPARAFIEAQDQEIAERSGNPRGPIKSMARSARQ